MQPYDIKNKKERKKGKKERQKKRNHLIDILKSYSHVLFKKEKKKKKEGKKEKIICFPRENKHF